MIHSTIHTIFKVIKKLVYIFNKINSKKAFAEFLTLFLLFLLLNIQLHWQKLFQQLVYFLKFHSIPIPIHWVIKTKRSFLRDKLMINKLYTLHFRHKKALFFFAFNNFLKICWMSFFHFCLKIFAWFYLIIWCKSKGNPPTKCLAIVILLYLEMKLHRAGYLFL